MAQSDLTPQNLQAVADCPADSFFTGLAADGTTTTLLLDLRKVIGNTDTAALTQELITDVAWKLLNLGYKAQDAYNQAKLAEDPSLNAFVQPVITVEAVQNQPVNGTGRAVLNVVVPYESSGVDPQTS